MRVNLLTDAPRHNLALMKIAAWHKAQGDTVSVNQALEPCDLSYGSWLFTQRYPTMMAGGPAVDPGRRLLREIEQMKPDYDLFGMTHSLGSTWDYCFRSCEFCIVPKQRNDKVHRSIWAFHDARFDAIEILNNNTFCDPNWRQTFEEIWDADLTVIDGNGYDLRLLDEEKAGCLKRTRFAGYIHFAWDRTRDEAQVVRGLQIAKRFNLRAIVYVLTGFDSTIDDDIHRCQRIHDLGFDPYVMIYNGSRSRQLRQLRWMVNRGRYYRKYPSIRDAWLDYDRSRPSSRGNNLGTNDVEGS